MMTLLAVIVGSYLLGSFPTAYLFVRRLAGVDIRTVSSGNVGATNAARVLGWKVAAPIFILDGLKGWAAVKAATMWVGMELWVFPPEGLRVIAAVCVIVGHVFPVFLKGKGGKGVATSAGAFFALDPFAMLMTLVVFGTAVSLSRYISVGSILGALALPVALYAVKAPVEYQWLSRAVSVMVIALHGPNLKRLWQGTEPKISMKVKPHE